MSNRPIPTPALLNRQAFKRALDVAYLYNILGSSAHNSHAYDRHVGTYEEQVAELHVNPPFMDGGIVPLAGTWLRPTFVPGTEHDWTNCCALRLDPTPGDDRPVGPDAPHVEVPRGRSLLSLDRLHHLFSNFQDSVIHHCHTQNRVLLFVPIKGSDERMPAVLREAHLSEHGFGCRLFLDAVIVCDHDRLMRYFGPPFYGWDGHERY